MGMCGQASVLSQIGLSCSGTSKNLDLWQEVEYLSTNEELTGAEGVWKSPQEKNGHHKTEVSQ